MEGRRTRSSRAQIDGQAVERGFVLVHLLSWIPIILVIVTSGALTLQSLTRLSQSHHACRQTVLKLQRLMGQSLNKLLDLNPQAANLRQRRRLAERLLKTAVASKQPAAIAAAKANLVRVIAEQMRLRARQFQFQLEVTRLRRSARFEIERYDRKLFFNHIEAWSPTPFGLPTEKRPPESLTPDHYAEASFSNKQTLHVSWTLRFFKSPLKGSCAATLRKENSRWVARLAAARS